MNLPKSIAEHIQCLARLTGAPAGFVGQVRALFSRKGISLNADASPYLEALDEAFKREENIRAAAAAAQRNLAGTRTRLSNAGSSYTKQLARLKKIRSDLESRSKRLGARRTKSYEVTEIAVPGDHRTFVTRPQVENLPMVPGPKEPQ